MLKNVMVGTRVSTDGNDSELITISKCEYDRLVREREEYREIALDLSASVPKLHEISENVEAILANSGGAQE